MTPVEVISMITLTTGIVWVIIEAIYYRNNHKKGEHEKDR